jgi:hypothetical protein
LGTVYKQFSLEQGIKSFRKVSETSLEVVVQEEEFVIVGVNCSRKDLKKGTIH